jgi:hypothetical protein
MPGQPITTFWAVRHKPTGYYLPDRPTSRSHVEPSADLPPRLFHKESAAKTFLNFWLKGRWRAIARNNLGDEHLRPTWDPSRKPGDMEIVCLELHPCN